MNEVIHLIAGQPAYWCPVCKQPHRINTDLNASKVAWSWNGDYVKPSFGPATPQSKFSILFFSDRRAYSGFRLVRPGKAGTLTYPTKEAAEAAAPGPEWKAEPYTHPAGRHVYCHVYVKAGMIQILPDSESLGGQTIPLQPWDGEKWT